MRELDDQDLAFFLATGIGEIARGTRAGGLLQGRELAQVANQVAQVWVDRVLEVHRPGDAMLSEDAADELSRTTSARVWVIDVIDGSKEFSTGREDWSVHVALVVEGVPGAGAALRRHAQAVAGRGACRHPDGVAGLAISAAHALSDHLAAHARAACPRRSLRRAG